MRKRIQQLARGKFEYARPLLSFSTDKVDIEVLEGKDYAGDFVITSANRVPLRGIIYTSDSRMECLTPQFEGEEVRIRYQFHSNGLVEGDIRKGEFFIICNLGEYNLSFVASISRLYAETSVGKIKTLSDFAKLSKESQTEAYHLFYSKNFKNIIKPEEAGALLLYEGLSRGAASYQKLEEFLVGIGRKQRVDITIAGTGAEYFCVTESRKETIEIRKSQWGYVDIAVRSDADFIVPGKAHLTEEDFIGSVCPFDYYIQEPDLHGGKNFGRLYFEFPGGELRYSLCVSRTGKKEAPVRSARREVKEARVRLLQLYMDYRLKKIVTGAWANQSIEILDHLMAIEPERELYQLMKAQALIVNKQRQEAAWIMGDYKRQCTDKESPEWGYYLYLCTLVEREPSYVDRMAEEIEILFRKNPDSSLLFWILLFVRESYYRNNSRRFKAIEQWMARGKHSPYLYLEAYYLLWQDPYLLGRLERFEIAVLNWAGKQKAISKDIALQVMNIAAEMREFDPFVYRILEECYRVTPREEMLAVICGYLIKGQRYETRYHRWYELGIEQEIRITGLYEAYLMSLDARQVGSVPKMIQMYFQYDSKLSYQQKAVLFVNIIAGKQHQPEVYQKYRRTMEQFAMEQMEAGNISDNLAVVYDEMLRAGILSKELAQRLSRILFTHKLTCLDEHVARALIFHAELKEPQSVMIANGTAYFRAYTDNYCIVLEDNRGNCFSGSIACQDEALLNPGTYMKQCLELAPEELPYILYHFKGLEKAEALGERDCRYVSLLLQSEKISPQYKSELIAKLLDYYQRRGYRFLQEDDKLAKFLVQTSADLLTAENRRHLMELLAEGHHYRKAYSMVQVYGYDYMGSAARVSLCSYAITDMGFEEDDFLLGFAESTFHLGKYNDIMLIYLCKYYNGPTKAMAELWRAAGEFQIDTFDLEERILVQMLYTTDYTPYAEQIYDSYYAGGGREVICMAYLSYYANCYLTQDAVVPAHVFVQLQERYLLEQELNEACRLGLLKYLAEKGSLTGKQRDIADALLAEYIEKNIYFAFYRRFERGLIMKYHLYDKFFLEYHTRPNQRVAVHFRRGEEAYQEEDLIEMYDGIYVMEFILFSGETVQYYITEEGSGGAQTVESNCTSSRNADAKEDQGRYTQLNEILRGDMRGDRETHMRQMKDYYGMLRVTEEVFKLL